MRVVIGGGPAKTEKSLRAAIRNRARGLRRAAAGAEDFTKAFIALDEALDAQVKKQFRTRPGWAALSETTQRKRGSRSGWYKQPGGGTRTGVWTGKLIDGLMGLGPNGSTNWGPLFYRRRYRTSGEVFRGRDVSKRAIYFHTGKGRQPARPLFARGEREAIAIRIIQGHIKRRITNPAQGKRVR